MGTHERDPVSFSESAERWRRGRESREGFPELGIASLLLRKVT